jgi:hypothetical protein
MDIRIERILRDVAVGNNRENWNLKGFYTKEEFDSNPDSTLEKCRDEVQRIAIAGLTSIISENEAMFLLDSIEKTWFHFGNSEKCKKR